MPNFPRTVELKQTLTEAQLQELIANIEDYRVTSWSKNVGAPDYRWDQVGFEHVDGQYHFSLSRTNEAIADDRTLRVQIWVHRPIPTMIEFAVDSLSQRNRLLAAAEPLVNQWLKAHNKELAPA